jgi:hypothetical protein
MQKSIAIQASSFFLLPFLGKDATVTVLSQAERSVFGY